MKHVRILIISVFLLVVAFLGFLFFEPGIKIKISNKTSYPLSDLTLNFTGGNKKFSSLQPQKSLHFFINPTSESHLELSYVHPELGQQYSNIEVYFEPGYDGIVQLEIQDNGEVALDSSLTVY